MFRNSINVVQVTNRDNGRLLDLPQASGLINKIENGGDEVDVHSSLPILSGDNELMCRLMQAALILTVGVVVLPLTATVALSVAPLQDSSGWAALPLLLVPLILTLSVFLRPSGLGRRTSYWMLCGAALLPSMPLVAAQTSQDIGVCGFIGAGNVAPIMGYDGLAYDTSGYTSTDPCDDPWTGVTCLSVDEGDTDQSIEGR